MRRRLLLFGYGVIISIAFLTMFDSENKLSNTISAYRGYFNPDQRVKSQFVLADVKDYSDLHDSEVLGFLKKAWVNHDLTDKYSYPQVFVLDNVINDPGCRLLCHFYDMEKRNVDGVDKRFSKIKFIKLDKGIKTSSRSYDSYFYLIGIFLLIMIPVFLLSRNLITKRRSQNVLGEEILTSILIILFLIFFLL